MTGELARQIEEAEAHLFQLRQRAATASCHDLGHDWRLEGGKNAYCCDEGCGCYVPVYTCNRCGNCDYGDNEEAEEIMAKCSERKYWLR